MGLAEEGGGVNLHSLLRSGKFSDLQLSCEGRNFSVHKNIICEQSRVINAACEGSFEESKTNIIKIEEFNADTVYTMLEFLYCRRYSVAPDTDPELPAVPRGKSRPHLNANAIGDYYDVQGLCELARSNVKKEVEADWSPDDFMDLLVEACSTRKTGDMEWYRLLGHIAAEHQEDLIPLGCLCNMYTCMPPAFFMSFISSSIKRVRLLEGRIRYPDYGSPLPKKKRVGR